MWIAIWMDPRSREAPLNACGPCARGPARPGGRPFIARRVVPRRGRPRGFPDRPPDVRSQGASCIAIPWL